MSSRKTQHIQQQHFARRARERHGIELSMEDIVEIKDIIKASASRIIFRESNRVTHHEVLWSGQTLHVVYDKKRNALVTVLTTQADGE